MPMPPARRREVEEFLSSVDSSDGFSDDYRLSDDKSVFKEKKKSCCTCCRIVLQDNKSGGLYTNDDD